jgi:hypothetical protein
MFNCLEGIVGQQQKKVKKKPTKKFKRVVLSDSDFTNKSSDASGTNLGDLVDDLDLNSNDKSSMLDSFVVSDDHISYSSDTSTESL